MRRVSVGTSRCDLLQSMRQLLRKNIVERRKQMLCATYERVIFRLPRRSSNRSSSKSGRQWRISNHTA